MKTFTKDKASSIACPTNETARDPYVCIFNLFPFSLKITVQNYMESVQVNRKSHEKMEKRLLEALFFYIVIASLLNLTCAFWISNF